MFLELGILDCLTLVTYSCALFFLAVYGLHRSKLLFLLHRNASKKLGDPKRFEHLPTVTIQLPVFNEANVVQRLIRAAANMDYPHEKLEIQVLDDSTDETKTIAQKEVDEQKDTGLQIHYLHRVHRVGFKAGALEKGMEKAKGDFLLILDADFVAPPSLLRDLIHFFTDPQVAMVQARWEYLNEEQSALTRSQAMLLNGHFKIEHESRFRSALFFNFNGTAGMWRKKAIEDAGGWEHDTITEDTDLSYRAQMRGWKMCYVDSVGVPSELPANMNAFKGQQKRWAKGLMQTARKILPGLFRMNLPFRIKSEAFFHLTSNVTAWFLLVVILLQLPNLYLRQKVHDVFFLLLDIPFFGGTFLSIAFFYLTAYKRTGKNIWHGMVCLPHMMAMGIGLSINNAISVTSGLISDQAEFVRTAKVGDARSAGDVQKKYTPPFSVTVFFEVILAVYLVWTLWVAVQLNMWLFLPFIALFAWGFFEVAMRSLFGK